MQPRHVGTGESRPRDLIEAYLPTHDRPPETEEAVAESGTASKQQRVSGAPSRRAEAAVVRALDFLDSCLRFPAEASAVDAARSDVPEKTAPVHARSWVWLSRVCVPRGLLYWLVVGAAGSGTWRSSSSLYSTAAATLLASAAVIVLELVLRAVDPRIARRLGLARPRTGVILYGAGVFLALVAGIVVAYAV